MDELSRVLNDAPRWDGCLEHFDINPVLKRHDISPEGFLLRAIPIETAVEIKIENDAKRTHAKDDKKDIHMQMGVWDTIQLIVDVVM